MNASPTPEQQLMLLMAGTADRRVSERDRILALIAQVDFAALERVLVDQSLLGLIGTRLEEVAPDQLSRDFRERVRQVTSFSRHRATLHEDVTLRLASELERAGIPAVPLKGSLLAEHIYGDPGLRMSGDIDLLVDRSQLDRAAGVLERQGYASSREPARVDGLPLLHHALEPRDQWLPPVDLHWRIHWNETDFASGLLVRSSLNGDGVRQPRSVDELAALLLFFARDSFLGLRLAADIAAWWDAYGEALEPVALEPLMSAHRELRSALLTAVAVVQRLVGVPADRLLSSQWEAGARGRWAARLANWTGEGEKERVALNMILVDWLLRPSGGQRAFARHYLFPPLPVVAQTYGFPEDARIRQHTRRILHGGAMTTRLLLNSADTLWSTRGTP